MNSIKKPMTIRTNTPNLLDNPPSDLSEGVTTLRTQTAELTAQPELLPTRPRSSAALQRGAGIAALVRAAIFLVGFPLLIYLIPRGFLDAQGDPNAEFVFQMGSTLTVATGSSVVMINGGQAQHVWWQVGSSATLGTGSSMLGNILASASITLTTGASVQGRVLAQSGAVTMDTNAIVGFNDAGTPTSKTTWGKVKSIYR